MKRSIQRTFFFVVLLCAFGVESLKAEVTNIVILDKLHDKYTVPEGKMAVACLRLIGSTSIESFQKEHLLATDGVVGVKTWAKLSEALESKGVEVKPDGQSPITITITQSGDQQICLEIHNRTATNLVIQAGESLSKSGAHSSEIRISLKFSGESNDRRFHGVAALPVELKMPLRIQPNGSFKLHKSYRRLGPGATELRASVVASQNGNELCLLNVKPLTIKGNVEFVD